MVLPDSVTKSPIIPSLVALDKRGRLQVGEDARPYVDLPGQGVREVKRLMGSGETVVLGDKEYRPEDISAIVLTKLMGIVESSLGREVRELVLSVPANFPDAARQATLNAGEIAGLHILKVINEPTAAAIAYGVKNIDLEAQLIVFDFGGGTLDITVMEMMEGVLDVRCSFGDPHLGGKDFDEVMISLIEHKFQEQHPGVSMSQMQRAGLKEIAEKTKIGLTASDVRDVFLSGAGTKDGLPVNLEIEVTRGEFETATAPLLERARHCLKQALKAGRIRPSSIDKVLLVGGTTYMPCIRNLVSEILGKEPVGGISPDLAVALGAATVAADALGILDADSGVVYTDVSAYGLGIEVLEDWSGRPVLVYDPLIEPNKPIPFSTSKSYSLISADQRELEIRLFQDHYGTARLCQEAIFTGLSGHIADIPPALYGQPHPVEVEFSYGSDGLVKVRASIPGMAKSVEITYDHNAARMSTEALEQSRYNLQDLMGGVFPVLGVPTGTEEIDDIKWREHPEARRCEPLIAKAERVMVESPEHRDSLKKGVVALKQSLTDGNTESINAATDGLTDILFDIDSAT
jgi:molecular chaperone DnaK